MQYNVSIINYKAIVDVNLSRDVIDTGPVTGKLISTAPWSPVLLQKGQNWLKQKNFQSINLLVLDIDNTSKPKKLKLDDAIKMFQNYQHIIGTSRNHQKPKSTGTQTYPPDDRYRVVLYFEENIESIEQYNQNWKAAIAKFGLEETADSTQDAARFFYPCNEIVSENDDGELLEVIALQQSARNVVATVLPANTVAKQKLPRDVVEFIAQINDNNDDWYNKLTRAIHRLRDCNYTIQEAEAELTKAAPLGHLTDKDLYQIKQVYGKKDENYLQQIIWPKMQPPGKHGPQPVYSSVENLEYLIENVLGYKLLYDQRASRIVKNERMGPPFDEEDFKKVRRAALQHKLLTDASMLDVILDCLALKNKYDVFGDMFKATWNGEDHIQALFDTMILPEDEPTSSVNWYKKFFERWMRAMAAKYYAPGSQNNVLVFVGTQGAGKSRWFDKFIELWPQGFKETSPDPNSKDDRIALTENFFWHIAELDEATSKRDVSALKNFLTTGTVSERRAYARKAETGKNICSFCASVNSTDFLHDTSGNRRYLVIPVRGLKEHSLDMRQVFAQAAHEYNAGEPWYFSRSEIVEIEKLTDMYRYKDELTERLELSLEPGEDKLTLHEIITLARRDTDSTSITNSKSFRISVSNMLLKKGFNHKNHSNRKVYSVNAQKLRDNNND